MFLTASVIMSLFDIICTSLCITITTFRIFGEKRLIKFVQYLVIIILFYSIGYFIYPHSCLVVSMVVIAVLTSRDTEDFLLSYYVSAFSASIVLYALIIISIAFQFYTPFNQFLTAYPFVFSLVMLFLCSLVSVFLNKNMVLFKSKHNMLLLGVYNTITLIIYLMILPMVLPHEEYANLSIILSVFVIISSILNVGFTLIINPNEAKKANEESELKLIDIKQKAAIKNYNEAIVFKHAFAGRYHALAYYIHKEDYQGLKEYFLKYIQPIYSSHQTNDKILVELEKIKDDAIKSNIFVLYDRCCSFGKKIRLYVFSDTDKIEMISDMSRTDFMAVMDIFCEIAYLEARDLQDSEVQVTIIQTEQKSKITFENIYGDIENQLNLKTCQMPLDEKNYHDEIHIIDGLNNKYKNVTARILQQDNKLIQEIEVV